MLSGCHLRRPTCTWRTRAQRYTAASSRPLVLKNLQVRSCVVDIVVVITFKFENMHLAFLRSLNSGFFFLNKCLYMQSKKEVSND